MPTRSPPHGPCWPGTRARETGRRIPRPVENETAGAGGRPRVGFGRRGTSPTWGVHQGSEAAPPLAARAFASGSNTLLLITDPFSAESDGISLRGILGRVKRQFLRGSSHIVRRAGQVCFAPTALTRPRRQGPPTSRRPSSRVRDCPRRL